MTAREKLKMNVIQALRALRGSQSGLLALFAVAEGIQIARRIAEYQSETDAEAEVACMKSTVS